MALHNYRMLLFAFAASFLPLPSRVDGSVTPEGPEPWQVASAWIVLFIS
jgi:hypothetical protein